MNAYKISYLKPTGALGEAEVKAENYKITSVDGENLVVTFYAEINKPVATYAHVESVTMSEGD